eukprot:2268389-Pleurochrysis_carterae.AAC.1
MEAIQALVDMCCKVKATMMPSSSLGLPPPCANRLSRWRKRGTTGLLSASATAPTSPPSGPSLLTSRAIPSKCVLTAF